MPLCGLKKSKAQKRDSSPPYSSDVQELTESKARIDKLNSHLSTLENEVKQYKSQYFGEERKCKKLEEETAKLKTQVEDLKDKERALLKKDVNVSSSTVPDEIEKMKTELEEELERTKKALDETKQQGEDKLNAISEELKQTKGKMECEMSQRKTAEEERERIKREKDSIKNTLTLTSKELELAKKESHIPRSPTRAPSDEWKAKIENAEAELDKERKQRLEKEKENSRLINDKELLEKEKEELQENIQLQVSRQKDELENMKKDLEMNHKNDIKRLEDKVKDTEEAKEKLLTRLSCQTATKVLDNNPDVADLADPNRPQKLGEQYSKVYDDQWTDASEGLEKLGINEDEAVKILLDLITTIYTHCKDAADNQMSRIEEDLFLPPLESASSANLDTNGVEHIKSPTSSRQSMSKIPRFTSSQKGRPALPNVATEKKRVDNDSPGAKGKDNRKVPNTFPKVKGEKFPEVPTEIRKGIKEYRKRVMKQVWPVLEKEVLGKLRSNEEFGEKILEVCMPYIVRCVELCWYMRVQDPPVVLSWAVPTDKAFNPEDYRTYLKTGTHIEYVVWPVMYLHEGGSILQQGVAQGCEL